MPTKSKSSGLAEIAASKMGEALSGSLASGLSYDGNSHVLSYDGNGPVSSGSHQLEVTDELINGDSDIIKAVAANIPDFVGNWDAVWENILLRGKLKELIVKYSDKANDPDMLEAPFVIKSNDRFHNIVGEVKEKTGTLDPKLIYKEFESWIKREAKKRQVSKEV